MRTSRPYALIALLALLPVVAVWGMAQSTGAGRDRPPITESAQAHPPPSAAARPSPSPRPPLPYIDRDTTWASWALLDRGTSTVTSGGQKGTSTTESMVKVAIAAQYLRELEDDGREPTDQDRDLLSRMIRHSDDDAAETLYRRAGRDRMLQAVVKDCGLRETRTKPDWWSETRTTAADAARLGHCVADGGVCSVVCAEWVLDQMRHVDEEGGFGIRDTRPLDGTRPIAIKNGYTLRGDTWHVSCLAVAEWWSLAVLVRYPAGLGLVHGAALCAEIADALAPENWAAPAVQKTTGAAGGDQTSGAGSG